MRYTETAGSLFEEIGNLVHAILAGSTALPFVRFAIFSGKDEDVISKDGAIYLRLYSNEEAQQDDGKTSIVARLVGPAALWHIPDVETQVIVIAPPFVGTLGSPVCIFGMLAPPSKVSITKAALWLSDKVTFISKARAHIFKSASGITFGTIPSDDTTKQGFFVGWDKGTRIVVLRDAIELQVTDGAESPSVRSMLRLAQDGIFAISGSSTMQVKHDGTFASQGSGFYAYHSGGYLGNPGTAIPVLGGTSLAAALPSLFWKVSVS